MRQARHKRIDKQNVWFRRLAGIALLAVLVVGARAQARPPTPRFGHVLPPKLVQLWQASKLPPHALSLVVQQVGGPRLLAINAKTPRNPASLMKLVTTWAALSALGPNYVWHTEFLSDPGVEIDVQGKMVGSLYLRASGDPFLRLEDFWVLLRDLRLHGVKQINDVVIDRTRFGAVDIDSAVFDGAPDRAYNASPDAWTVNFGASRFLFLPNFSTRQWTMVLDPALPGVQVAGQLTWGDEELCTTTPEVKTELVMTPQGITVRVSGVASGACGEFSLYRLVLPQADFASAVFRLLWQDMGGTFTGQIRSGKIPLDAVPLVQHESPPLADVIRLINKHSNNLMARLLLLTLGAEQGGQAATPESSAAILKQVLKEQGLALPELVIENGAGLSRQARVSAESLAALLTVAWRSPYMPEFVSSLAIGGMDGTLQNRLYEAGGGGRTHLKTGTLKDAQNIAGYVFGARGKRYVVVMMVNDEYAAAARPFEDALIEWLAAR